ncbi:thioredoxin-disulfide reductase [Candidatus Gottesmanbacteria bacterium]|nr:thioredoxin-disulfide reductase [Candidatus Gottesmanbacteria bacterium]
MNIYDVIIIGSGPAGYTAAVYASRAFLKTLLLTGIQFGGQLTTTTDVDNYPGFAEGIKGPTLMEEMKRQAERFGTEIVTDAVTKLKTQNSKLKTTTQNRQTENGFILIGQSGKEYEGRSVIVATGAQAQYLGLPSEQKLMGKGVSGCATCDGFFFRGKEVVVVGGGDTAMEEATFLTTFASHVTIIHRREEFRASAIMLDRARKNPKISFLLNKTVEEVLGESVVTGVRLKDNKTGVWEDIKTDGLFLAIGHKPSTEFLKGFVELDEKGYIKIANSKYQIANSQTEIKEHNNPAIGAQTATSVEGIFAAGDCVDPRYRQAVVAAGQGCMAAIDAHQWLSEQSR